MLNDILFNFMGALLILALFKATFWPELGLASVVGALIGTVALQVYRRRNP